MATITIPDNFRTEYNGKVLTAGDLVDNVKAVAYLLEYGWSQSLQDKVSGAKDKVLNGAADVVLKTMKTAGLTVDGVDVSSLDRKALAETILSAMMDSRAEAILDGTVGHRTGGQRLDPVDRAIRDIVDGIIVNRARAKKLPVPKGQDLADLRDDYLTNVANATRVKAMAEARVAEEAELAADAAE